MRNFFIRLCQRAGLLPNLEVMVHEHHSYSPKLSRMVKVDVYLPKDFYVHPKSTYSILYINDGQDMERVALKTALESLMNRRKIGRVIVVAIHANERRMLEYGTASTPDYKNRGSLAHEYTRFITEELILFIRDHYQLSRRTKQTAFAGFSLGGLSAFDIAWHYPHFFNKVGVFSGSFWWRSAPMLENDPDADRIVHNIIRFSNKREGMKFWLQTGTEDEKEDRNRNGVIDAIDDTLDVIKELKTIGHNDRDIEYVEVQGGKHHTDTWRDVMPNFLTWAFAN